MLIIADRVVAPVGQDLVRFLGGGSDNNVKDTSVEYVSVSELMDRRICISAIGN